MKKLLISVFSLLLCVVLLVGTTFAWFTDTITTNGNVITTGKLKVKLYSSQNSIDWSEVTDNAPVISDVVWEPGFTKVYYFKIENAGNLAFNFDFSIGGNNLSALADVIELYGAQDKIISDKTALGGDAVLMGSLTDLVNTTLFSGKLLPNGEAVYAVAFKMREDANNTYKNLEIKPL